MIQFYVDITLGFIMNFFQKCICKPGNKRKNNTDSRRSTARTQHTKKRRALQQDKDVSDLAVDKNKNDAVDFLKNISIQI